MLKLYIILNDDLFLLRLKELRLKEGTNKVVL